MGSILSWLGKTAKSLFIFLFFFFPFLLSWTYYTEGSTGKCYVTSVTITVTWQEVTASHYMMSHDRHGKEVHRPCSSCISSVEKSNKNSIEFSLSNTDKGAVGLILALELASLTLELDSTLWALSALDSAQSHSHITNPRSLIITISNHLHT